MNSMKKFEIQLTDIWNESEKQLIEMKNKNNYLIKKMKIMEKINKHLTDCNESLVNIIEKCDIHYKTNIDIISIINVIKSHENQIEKYKSDLNEIKPNINDLNIENDIKIINDWHKCKPIKCLTFDECIQTDPEEYLFERVKVEFEIPDNINENQYKNDSTPDNETEFKIDSIPDNENFSNDITIPEINESEIYSNDNSVNRIDSYESGDDMYSPENNIVSSEDIDGNDSNDNDWQYRKRSRKISLQTTPKTSTEVSDKTKVLNELVLPFKYGDYYKCNDCSFKSTSKLKFAPHIRNHMREKGLIPKLVNTYRCEEPDCDFEINNKTLLLRHVAKHCKSKGIPIPEKYVSRRRELDQMANEYRVGDQYVCKEPGCEFSTSYKKYFLPHFNSHKVDKEGLTRRIYRADGVEKQKIINRIVMPCKVGYNYVCKEPDCGFKSTVKEPFLDHYNNHQIEKGLDITDPDIEVEKIIDEKVAKYKVENNYECDNPDCGYKTTSKKLFFRHIRNHEDDFTQYPSLRVRSTTENPRPYKCDWPGCDMAFKVNNHLKGHYKTHTKERPYPCEWPGCDKKCITPHHLKVHTRSHTNEKPYKCDWPGCEYATGAKWCIVAHKRSHSGEKPHACDWPDCSFRSSQSSSLVTHKRKHTGEKPYPCIFDKCDKRYSSLAGLHQHKKSHKNKEYKSSKTKKKAIIMNN